MSIKAKARRRVLILISVFLVICISLASIYFIRKKQFKTESLTMRVQGIALIEKKQYFKGLHEIGSYIGRMGQKDVEANYYYALAQLNVPEINGRHLVKAAERFRIVHSLDPTYRDVVDQLLKLYPQIGYHTEAMTLADTVLAKSPDHPKALYAKAYALFSLRKYDEAIKMAQYLATLAPQNFENATLLIEIMRTQERPASQLTAYAEDLRQRFPNDPAADVLVGQAYLMSGDIAKAIECYKQAKSKPLPNEEFALKLFTCFSLVREYTLATDVLSQLVPKTKNPVVRRFWARRLWELGRLDELAGFLADEELDSPYVFSETQALRILAMIRLDRKDETAPLLKALEDKKEDTAQAWHLFLAKMSSDSAPTSLEIIEVIEEALARDSRLPYVHFFLARAYWQIGEKNLTQKAATDAIRRSPAWLEPILFLADVFQKTNQPEQGYFLAQAALKIAPNSLSAALSLASNGYILVKQDKIKSQDQDKFLEFFKKLYDEKATKKATLVMYVDLLLNANQREQAIAICRDAIQAKDQLDRSTLLQLLALSDKHQLGLDSLIVDQIKAVKSNDAQTAYALALYQAKDNLPQVVKLFEAAMQQADDKNEIIWQLTWARVLEQANDPRAAQAWTALVNQDENKNNAMLLDQALQTRCLQKDKQLIDQLIKRLREITGETALNWRIQRAKWYLRDQTDKQAISEASKLLDHVVKSANDLIEPRMMLAQCLSLQGNLTGALEQLKEAAQRKPNSITIQLNQVDIHQQGGDYEQAYKMLQDLLKRDELTPPQLRTIASLLHRQGKLDEAGLVLKRIPADAADASSKLMLAQMYRQQNQPAKVDQLVTQLLASPSPTIPQIEFALDFYATQKRSADVQALLNRLTQLNVTKDNQHLIKANYLARHVALDQALAECQKARKINPKNEQAQILTLIYQAQSNQYDDFFKTVEEAATQLPENKLLALLKENQSLLAEVAKLQVAQSMIRSIITSPSYRTESIDVLKLIQQASSDPAQSEKVTSKLRQLADRRPRFLALQTLVVRLYLAAGRNNEAAAFALRGMGAFPNAVEPALLAAQALAAASRWEESLEAAQQWRIRSLGQNLNADLMIAEAQMKTKQADQAVVQLRTYLDKALIDPDKNAKVILSCLRAMIAADQNDQATAILLPLAKQSKDWRAAWIKLAVLVIPDVKTASDWLKQVEQTIPADALDEQVTVATAWRGLDERYNKPELSDNADQMLVKIVQQDNPPVSAYVALGMLRDAQGQLDEAEKWYRQVLKRDQNSVVVMNNLAMILMKKQGQFAEAEQLAAKAVELAPNIGAFHDTYAQILSAQGKHDQAIKEVTRAVQLDQRSVELVVSLMEVLIKADQIDKATKVNEQLSKVLPGTLAPELKKRLDAVQKQLEKK